VLFRSAIIFLWLGIKLHGKIILEETTKLYFRDNRTGCLLNGQVYINDRFLGNTTGGLYELTLTDENTRENSTLYISGVTSECFRQDKSLPFTGYWILTESAFESKKLILQTKLSPREPKDYRAMQGFVRPGEVQAYLPEIEKYFKSNETEENLDKIAKYKIRYIDDFTLFKQDEYWQTPAETLEKGHGDCEDWAITTLSLILAYNPSLKCHNLVWKSHISILCYVNGSYIIYDQNKIKHKITLSKVETPLEIQENKVKLREWRNKYFDDFGISVSERKILALFNEKELVEFENDEQFINWLFNLNK